MSGSWFESGFYLQHQVNTFQHLACQGRSSFPKARASETQKSRSLVGQKHVDRVCTGGGGLGTKRGQELPGPQPPARSGLGQRLRPAGGGRPRPHFSRPLGGPAARPPAAASPRVRRFLFRGARAPDAGVLYKRAAAAARSFPRRGAACGGAPSGLLPS